MPEVICNPPPFWNENLVMGVDQYRRYLGWIDKTDPRIALTVTKSPPNDDPWIWHEESNDWIRCWYISKDDLKPSLSSENTIGYTIIAPPSNTVIWNEEFQNWIETEPLQKRKSEAIAKVLNTFNLMLKTECGSDEEYLKELQCLYTAIQAHLTTRNLPDTKRTSESVLTFLDSFDVPDITFEDIKANSVQFDLSIRDII